MHHKIIHTDSFDYRIDEPLTRILPVSSRGLDYQYRKVANVFELDVSDIKPIDNHTILQLVAMGAGERVGPNRNADWFSRSTLKDHHKTFEKHAAVYKHHDSRPEVASGQVLRSAFNEAMDRVELIVGVDNRKWASELSKLERGEDLKFSMGCDVTHDVCRICGNQARNRTEYCECMKKHAREILADGQIVCVDNPKPVMRDISYVIRPADRTAFILKKVAAEGGFITGADLYDLERPYPLLDQRYFAKKRAAEKLGRMLKEIELVSPADNFNKPTGSVVAATGMTDEDLEHLRAAASGDCEGLMSELATSKIAMSFPDFLQVFHGMPRQKAASLVADLSLLSHEKVAEEAAKFTKFDGGEAAASSTSKTASLAAAASMLPQHVLRRYGTELLRTTTPKTAAEYRDAGPVLAGSYARYCSAALAGMTDGEIKVFAVGLSRNWQ